MSCNINSGFQLGSCASSTGGLNKLFIGSYSANVMSNVVLSVDEVATSIPGMTFYQFDLVLETASANQKVTQNIQNLAKVFEPEIEVFIPKNSATLRNQYKALASSPVVIIAEDRNGTLTLYGKELGLYLTDGSVNSGKASLDANGYTLKFTGKESAPGYIVSATTSFTYSY